jgi:hypothetical protein
MSDWVPRSYVAKVVYAAGFEYEPAQDIIKSIKDPLQRKTGFTWGYDMMSPHLSMIIDAEPFYFPYGGKHWLIELWKGQYGLETGCEIGVYNRVAAGAPDSSAQWRFYAAAAKGEELLMSATLFRNGQQLFRRGPEKHWWLTGFKWGVFTPLTTDLSMRIEIELADRAMRDAFKACLLKRRYPTLDRGRCGIAFDFYRTTWPQPTSRRLFGPAAQAKNQALVNKYNQLKKQYGITSNDPNQFDAWDAPATKFLGSLVDRAAQVQSEAARRLNALAAAASRLPGAASGAVKKLRDELANDSRAAHNDMVAFFEAKRKWHATARL